MPLPPSHILCAAGPFAVVPQTMATTKTAKKAAAAAAILDSIENRMGRAQAVETPKAQLVSHVWGARGNRHMVLTHVRTRQQA